MKVNIKLQIGETIGFFVAFALALFLPAGTLVWPAGWAFLLLFFGFYLAVTIWLFNHNPGLMQERLHLGTSDQQGWDKVLFPLMAISPLAGMAFMSFDAVRFHWSSMPAWLQIFGAIILLGSFYLLFLTFRENSLPRLRCSYTGGARARGCVYRALQACASSHVCRHPSLYGRNVLPAGFLVWIVFCIPFYRPDGLAGSAGRKDFARTATRLCSLYGASKISSHSLCLVKGERRHPSEKILPPDKALCQNLSPIRSKTISKLFTS